MSEQSTTSPSGQLSSSNTIVDEQEPLLGLPGDVIQDQQVRFWNNLTMGTGFLAQIGALLLFGAVWTLVFVNPRAFVSAHPLLNSLAVLLLTQGILVLQPTARQQQKIKGTYIHSVLNGVAAATFAAAAAVIFINKGSHIWQIKSAHALLGLITYVLLVIQLLVGVCQFYFPALFGGRNNAKKLYKYHRASGYLLLIMLIVVVCLATQTDYNKNVIGLRLWVTVAAGILILMGTLPRIKKTETGLLMNGSVNSLWWQFIKVL